MKKIILITGVFLPEPIVSARLMADLAEELSRHYDVTVLRPHPSRPMGFQVPQYDFSDKRYKVVEIDAYVCPKSAFLGRFRESKSYGNACIRYMEPIKSSIDFVYNGAWHLFGRKKISVFCKHNNIRNITPVQDVYPESLLSKLPRNKVIQYWAKTMLMPIDMETLHNADKVHTISEGMKEYLSRTRGLSPNRFVVVRNWQDERDFTNYAKTAPLRTPQPFTFMFMGNVGALAGLDVVIEAFAKASINNSRLVIAGSGSAKDSLMKLSSQYSSCDIQFWDVPFGKVPETQFLADVMVLPVKKGYAKSSIPSKLPAYMFSSKPVLASVDADSDTALCIKQSNSGWVCEPENIDEIAKTMQIAALTSQKDINSMGEKGFEFAIREFSRTENLKKLSDACIEIIEK